MELQTRKCVPVSLYICTSAQTLLHHISHTQVVSHTSTSCAIETHHHVLSHISTVTFYDGHQDDDDKEEECHVKNQPHILWSWQTESHQQEAGTQQYIPHSHSHVLYPQMEINESLRKSCSQYGLVNCALLQVLLINATSVLRPQSMAHRRSDRSDRRNTSTMNRANVQPMYLVT